MSTSGVAAERAAFFDLDKTIIARASMSVFKGPLYEGGLLSRRALLRALFAQLVTLHLGASEPALVRVRSSVLRLARGWDRAQVSEIVEEALERIVDPIIYAEAMDLIDEHRLAGRRVVIVSASPEEIVVPLGRYLAVNETISSRAATDELGRYTGELEFYAYGEQKAAAVRAYAAAHNIDLLASYAYSDSRSDVPMLELVGNPVVVNADRELRDLARERGWEIRSFTNPVRLRDRMRTRVHLPERRVATSAASVGLGGLAVALSWWAVRRRAKPRVTPEIDVLSVLSRPSERAVCSA